MPACFDRKNVNKVNFEETNEFSDYSQKQKGNIEKIFLKKRPNPNCT